jgi:hypothetical protein
MLKHKKILIISPEAWGNNFVSKHHYAHYLAEKNTVFFLNPASGFNKNPFGNCKITKRKEKDNLFIFDYINLLPRLNNLPKKVQQQTYQKQAKQLQNFMAIAEFDIVWSFDPYRYWDLNCFASQKRLYHTVDFHPEAKFEAECCASADLILGVTELVIQETKSSKKIHKIGHGADLKGFNTASEIEIPGKNKLKACYVGNFHNHIDYSILKRLCENNPQVDFLMIGPTLDSNLSSGNKITAEIKRELASKENLFFIGSVEPNKLMPYLTASDINLVLFKKEHEKTHCSPHKLMGYFYSGKITLSNYIDEHKNTSPDIIKMLNEQNLILEEFSEIVKNLDQYNSKDLIEKRRKFAEENSYSNKIYEISKLIYL